MSREWVDDRKKPPRPGQPDTRDKRWVMRCDVGLFDGNRCSTESEPFASQPPLTLFRERGWFIAAKHGDVCPSCLAAGVTPNSEPWIDPTPKED